MVGTSRYLTPFFSDSYVPQTDGWNAGWTAATNQQALYQNVIAQVFAVCVISCAAREHGRKINFRSFLRRRWHR